jgi:tRNA-dihydrouridine synthase B
MGAMIFQKASNPFVLAPMAGITDMPFRRLMKRMGAGLVISEFVSAHAIVYGGPRVGKYMSFHPDERPVGIQIFGGDDQILAEASKKLEDHGVDFVDINMGCPVPKVTRKGGGSAWLCQTSEMGAMLKRVKAAIKIPLTVKIRTGWDSSTINAQEIIHICAEEGVEMVAVHGRTRAQGYAGSADWDLIAQLSAEAKIPVIGNGDLVSGPLAAARLALSGCSMAMIGRGALKNPWIFKESVEAWDAIKDLEIDEQRRIAQETLLLHRLPPAGEVPEGKYYYERKVKRLQPLPVNFTADWIRIRADRDAKALVNLHLEYLREAYPEPKVVFAFRKFLAWYSAGYPGSHNFRKFIFNHENFDEIMERSLEFFESVKQLGSKADELREEAPVLMSGHG